MDTGESSCDFHGLGDLPSLFSKVKRNLRR